MDVKRNRRGFLKNSAALATGLAIGAVRPASAQEPASPDPHHASLPELIAYGERSRFVTSMRVPVADRMSPDMFGLTFHVRRRCRIRSASSRPRRSSMWRPTAAPSSRRSIPASIG